MSINYAGPTHSPVEHDAFSRTTMTPLKATHHGAMFPFTATPPSLPPDSIASKKQVWMPSRRPPRRRLPHIQAPRATDPAHSTQARFFRRRQTTQRSSRSRWRSTDAEPIGDYKEIKGKNHHNVSSCATNTHFGYKAAIDMQYKLVKRAGQSHQFPLMQTPPLPHPQSSPTRTFLGLPGCPLPDYCPG